MKLLFTGKTEFDYNRVRVLIAGLQKTSSVELTIFPFNSRRNFDKKRFHELQKQCDFVYIPPFRHRDVSFIRRLTSKPIVFDPLISKYLTKDDFGHFWKLPFKYLLDKIPFDKCDILIADTLHHKTYFSRKFNIAPEKIHVLPIGVDTTQFFKVDQHPSTSVYKVGFYGSFVPLQGTNKIVEAANLLKGHSDIHFELIGGGYRFDEASALAKKFELTNISFPGKVRYEELNARINAFDLCLGIFGGSAKSDYVIPNKIFHYAATGKCILTKESDGMKEIFTDGKDVVFCTNDAADIAAKILQLKSDRERANGIGARAYQLITEKYNEMQIANMFLTILEKAAVKTFIKP